MTTEDWALAWATLQSASELPPDQRLPFVESSALPAHIRRQVRAMLENQDEEFEQPKPGQKYGRYTLIALIGRGGSGDVYSARDGELGRLVAVKFLKQAARLLPSARERLVREAQAASALNHPNLVTVYEVIDSACGTALVTELVDGQSLRSACGKPHPVGRLAEWGLQIARGLAAAHDQGIVHGDIKPENVMARKDGYLKVVDFGLAQADLGGHRASHNVDSIPLGTLGYMSPEQLEGKPAGTATDVFSLGVVLYELAAGKHPFREETAAATTRAILERVLELPPIPELRSGSSALTRLVREMTAKPPARRPSAAEVARRLERLQRASPPLERRTSVALAGLSAALVAGALLWWRSDQLRIGTPVRLAELQGAVDQAGFSPDGSRIVFIWAGPQGDNFDVYVRSVDRDDVRRLTSDPREEYSPAWSPDGSRIAFLRRAAEGADSELMVMDSSGGDPRLVARVLDHEGFRGVAWWPDAQSLIVRDASSRGRALTRIHLVDGRKQTITTSIETQDYSPAVSPDGRRLAYLRQSPQTRYLCLKELDSGADSCGAIRTGSPATITWLADSSTLLYADGKTLFSVAIDSNGEIGRPTALAEGVAREVAADRQGRRIVYSRVFRDQNLWRLRAENGTSSSFDATLFEESEPDYSPDGETIVYRSNRSGNYQLYLVGKDGGSPRQLTALSGHVGSPRFSPDGKWIVFDGGSMPMSNGTTTSFNNIFVISPDGGPIRQLTDDTAERIVPGWSRDGKWVYYVEERGSLRETWKLPLDGGAAVRVSETEMFDLREDDDGRWVYYTRPRAGKGIWRRLVSGGGESLVPGTEEHRYRCWDLRRGKLYFLKGVPDFGFVELNVATGLSRKIGEAPVGVTHGGRIISASPDGANVVFTQLDKSVGSLFLATVSGRGVATATK